MSGRFVRRAALGRERPRVAFDGADWAAWVVDVSFPWSSDASKNMMWQPIGNGRMIQRKATSRYIEAFGEFVGAAMPSSQMVVEHRLWLDIVVEKPSHRSDALNVLDVVADMVQGVTGLDDRWYAIHRLDWAICREEPQIWLAFAQERGAVPSQVCGRCGEVLPLTPDVFGRNKARKRGFSGTCKPCESQRRREGVAS